MTPTTKLKRQAPRQKRRTSVQVPAHRKEHTQWLDDFTFLVGRATKFFMSEQCHRCGGATKLPTDVICQSCSNELDFLIGDLYEAQLAMNEGASNDWEIKKTILHWFIEDLPVDMSPNQVRLFPSDMPQDVSANQVPTDVHQLLEKLIDDALFLHRLRKALAPIIRMTPKPSWERTVELLQDAMLNEQSENLDANRREHWGLRFGEDCPS